MRETAAWLAGTDGAMRRAGLARRDLRADDLAVRVDYCGLCHSDLHALAAHGESDDPLVPGHEFTGVVTAAGPAVGSFSVGDRVAVGNIVDSCGECAMCIAGQENFCRRFPTLTYGGIDRIDGSTTLGAFSREYVVREGFAHHLPDALDAAAAAPLLCAGVTVWEPLRSLQVGPGTSVAVVGLGGLGHLAVKLAVALGAEVTVISRTRAKEGDALALGARDVVVSSDREQLEAARERFDVILDTVSAPHDLGPYLSMVAMDGTLSVLGHLGEISVRAMDLLVGRKSLSSAGSGGRRATAELLEFCAEHDIAADVEVMPSTRIDEALQRLEHGDVRYRLVMDMSDLDSHLDSELCAEGLSR